MENELHTTIIDHLCDPHNREKQAAVNAWLDASDDNRRLYQEMKTLWETAGQLPTAAFDQQAGWQTLSQQLNINRPSANVYAIRPAKSTWWRVAAVAIPLLALGGYFWMQRGAHDQWSSYAAKGNTIDSLRLPDGSNVYLQPGTAFTYNNNGSQRQVKLQSGEAFFNIVKDAQRPFRISVANATINVLGTSFNVKTTATYSDITVRDGKVSVGLGQQEPVILTAGNLAIVADNSVSKASGDYSYRCGWSNHDLAFNNQEVATVLQTLEQYYHVRLSLQNDAGLRNRITIRFNNVALPEALLVMAEMLDLHPAKVSDTAYVFTNK